MIARERDARFLFHQCILANRKTDQHDDSSCLWSKGRGKRMTSNRCDCERHKLSTKSPRIRRDEAIWQSFSLLSVFERSRRKKHLTVQTSMLIILSRTSSNGDSLNLLIPVTVRTSNVDVNQHTKLYLFIERKYII